MADDVKVAIRASISIQAGGLGAALQALSRERKIHIIFVNEDVVAFSTRGVSGMLTTDEALLQLLEGTGLTFRYIDAETVSIVPVAAVTTSVLPAQKILSETSGQGSGSGWPVLRTGQGGSAAGHDGAASDSARNADAAHATDAASLITEVIVTSRRFSELVRDVPISISAYDSKTLDVAGVKDFSGVAQFTPGVTFSPGNNLIAIRGI
ncbi:MAG TPA: hypothetical protein VFR96_01090, partial [Povalibacter sp.]|nr:hypothetical protein [Povalibacter sp.]